MRKIVCKRPNGRQLTITNAFPFFLYDIDGITSEYHTITTTKGFNQDGVRRTGSTANPRNIVITVQVKDEYERRRNELYDFFQPKETGEFFYYEGAIARKISYEVESIANPTIGAVRLSTISLLCADPLFSDLQETKVSLSAWRGNIRFPLYIHNPFYVATKVNKLIENIYNPSKTTIGLRLNLTASGEVVRPELYDITRRKSFAIDYTMHAGDALEVVTTLNAKRATLHSGGVDTNVINKIEYPPNWPMLYEGDNTFTYNAESGMDALGVDIFYTQKYWGC